MHMKLLQMTTCLLVAALLLLPVSAISKPSVSSDNYKPQQNPPSGQSNASQQTQLYDQSMGGNEFSGPSTVPPTTPPEAIPEPMTLILFGLGVAGAGVATRMRKREE